MFFKISFAYVFIVIFVRFLKIYISRGSVATQLRCDGIFSNHFITNFPKKCVGEKFENPSIFGENMEKNLWLTFLVHPVVHLSRPDGLRWCAKKSKSTVFCACRRTVIAITSCILYPRKLPIVLHLDLEMDNNCQSPDWWIFRQWSVHAYKHDVADRWLLKDDTEANEVMESGNEFPQ